MDAINPGLLLFSERAAAGPQAVQKAKLFRRQPLAMAQTELALRPPALGMAKIGLAVVVPAGMPAAVRSDRQADDIGPTQPAPFDEYVRLRPAAARSPSWAEPSMPSSFMRRSIGTRSIVAHAYALQAHRSCRGATSSNEIVGFREGSARRRKGLAR
jgi:hypothetical protein